MNITTYYRIASANIKVVYEDELLYEKMNDSITDYFTALKIDSPDAPHITLNLQDNPLSFKPPKTCEIFTSPTLTVFKNKTSCYLQCADSLAHLNIEKSEAEVFFEPSFWARPPKLQQEFLMLSFLWLFRKHGLYGLHGNALVKDGLGILIAGDTGSGKSTATTSLISHGWGYLSDDVTLLRQIDSGIEASAFPRGFSIDPRLCKLYPELNAVLKTASSNGHKRFVDIEAAYPKGFTPSCVPNILLFPSIVPDGKSRIVEINKTVALILLMQNSGGIMIDKEMVNKQAEVLRNLVRQTSNYRLFAGRDLFEEPWKISEMLPILKVS